MCIRDSIDEEVKAVDGSRVRLRLLDDIEIGDETIRKGTYLYATMSGFGKQRLQGKVESIFLSLIHISFQKCADLGEIREPL